MGEVRKYAHIAYLALQRAERATKTRRDYIDCLETIVDEIACVLEHEKSDIENDSRRKRERLRLMKSWS